VDRYAGSAACAPCHPRESRQQGDTHHARTLAPVTAARERAHFASPGCDARFDHPAAHYTTAVRGGECVLRVEGGGGSESMAARYAFGSGPVGVTYVGRDARGFVQLAMSYYARQRTWYQTPGTEAGSPAAGT